MMQAENECQSSTAGDMINTESQSDERRLANGESTDEGGITAEASYESNDMHSPEHEDLMIDEGDAAADEADDLPVSASSPPSSPPPVASDDPPESPEQGQSQGIQSPLPTSTLHGDDGNIQSPEPEPATKENDNVNNAGAPIPAFRRHSSIDVDEIPEDHNNQGHENDEDVDMYGDIEMKEEAPIPKTSLPPPTSPPSQSQDGPSSPVEDKDTPSSPQPEPQGEQDKPPSSPSDQEDDKDSSNVSPSKTADESMDASNVTDEPQSPEASNQSMSNGAMATPGSPEGDEESQPASDPKKRKADSEPEEGEDLEDGEIMDEDEEEGETKPPPKKKEKEPVVEKSPKETKTKSSEKKRESKDKKEELDPVKRLLAEVREKDNKEREEREKRRKEKKRSHREDRDKTSKEKEIGSSKKKKRRVSEEEEEGGEEFLFVRGASPGADGAENWDMDERRNKRRRDSEEGSPGHRHRRAHEGSSSPPRGNSRPNTAERPRSRREPPKSDIICAYFMQGKCQKSAEQCNFSHDAIPPRKMELCKFWMMECCAKKEKCLYLHNDFPCKYFHTGLICRLGDKCKFSHNPLSDVTKQVLLKHIETAPKEILGDFPRLNRTGALNLINKMEAKLKGLPYVEDENNENDAGENQGPHHDRHGPPDRHGPDRHDRHHHNDRQRDNRGHFDDRGGRGGARDRGDRDMHRDRMDRERDRRQSRWEQSQPTKGDQEKLHELMNEAGIAGYYQETLAGDAQAKSSPQSQSSVPPVKPATSQASQLPQFPPTLPPNIPAPLLPLLLPGMQGLPGVNNPALASVLAQLNLPNTSILPPNITQFPPPSFDTTSQSQQNDSNKKEETKSGDSSIPDNLPKMQRELFERIQQQQKKNQNKVQTPAAAEPEEPEENWYSDEEDEDPKKKEERKADLNEQISSVLSQIRQQSQQSATATKEPEKTFFGDTDLRASTTSKQTEFNDVDLRTSSSSSIFKKINILPATEINASLSSHPPTQYKVYVVAGLRDKPDYSQVRQTLPPQNILLDPRLGPKRQRSDSIPAPASPTDPTSDSLNQPMSIPDATPVFDPRTAKSNAPSRALLETPNPFEAASMQGMPGMNMNDFNPFARDPRAPPGNPPAAPNAAQLANFAALMQQQQWPSGQPMDPSLFMLGFPFGIPPNQGGGGQGSSGPGMDFNMMQNPPGMRMRPPFMPGNQQATPQAPPASSWERFNRGHQGNLSPPL